LLVVITLLLLLIAIPIGLFWNELCTLASLKKVDDYPMYQMTYQGDYGFDEFVKTGAESDADIEAFVTKRLLKGLPVDLGITEAGCTAFAAKNEKGEVIYGRNFDFGFAPSLQVYTKPDNGYASVSTVNLTFAGYSEDSLPDGLSFDSFLTLVAPYLPFDGMNEKGVVIALLAVPEADLEYDSAKIIACDGVNIGEGFTEFERYETVKARIEGNGGVISEDQATELLAEIGIVYEDTDKLQWSVLYNLTTGDGSIFAHRNTDNIINFHLNIDYDGGQ
jgi:hypothetical protein